MNRRSHRQGSRVSDEQRFSDPERSIADQTSPLLANLRWALRLTWATNRRMLGGVFVSALLGGLVPAALALVAKGLIDAVMLEINSTLPRIEPILPWIAAGLILTLVEGAIRLSRPFLLRRLEDDLNIEINTRILNHTAELDVAYFEDPGSQDVLQRAKQNTAPHFTRFLANTFDSATSFIQVISLGAVLVVIEPLIVVVVLPLALPYLRFKWKHARRLYATQYARAKKRRWTAYYVSLLTTRRSVPEIRILRLAPLLVAKFRSLMKEFRDEDRNVHFRGLKGGLIFATLSGILFYLLLVRVIVRALEGAATLGDLAIFAGATLRLRNGLDRGIVALSGALEGTLFISNLKTFLDEKPHIHAARGKLPASCRGEVSLENVHFTYPGSATPAVEEISFKIEAGETLVLVGENGSGKTTLAKLIARLYDPTLGRVMLDGHDLRDLDIEYLHSQIAFVFENFGRYEATAGNNIAYGDWQRMLSDAARIEETARLTGIHDLITALPDGYDTLLGRKFGHHDLSAGQWQKMAAARAFARSASLLILDEPTSNLDARSEYKLFEWFRELAHARTTLLISHRFSTVRLADRIMVMKSGRIIEKGTHQELMSQAGHYCTVREVRVVNSGWIFVVSKARDAAMPGVFRGSATKLSAKRRPK